MSKSNKSSPEVRERAVRMVQEHRAEYPSLWAAIKSIYRRPNAGRADLQSHRNHAVQYFAYPDHKFDRLRREGSGEHETYADIGLDERITMRVHVKGGRADLYLNDARFPSFIVNQMKGGTTSGGIGFFVDIGTVGYFKDFKIISSMDPQSGI